MPQNRGGVNYLDSDAGATWGRNTLYATRTAYTTQRDKPMENLNIPGVNIETTTTLDEYAKEKVRNEAERASLEMDRKETRIKSILSSVQQSLNRGDMVEITDEMKELGLETQLRAKILKADSFWKLNQALMSDPEDSYDPGQNWL